MTKTHVKLTPEHDLYLTQLLSKGTLPVKAMKRATALLELHKGKTFGAVAQTLSVDYQTVSTRATKYKTEELALWGQCVNGRIPCQTDLETEVLA